MLFLQKKQTMQISTQRKYSVPRQFVLISLFILNGLSPTLSATEISDQLPEEIAIDLKAIESSYQSNSHKLDELRLKYQSYLKTRNSLNQKLPNKIKNPGDLKASTADELGQKFSDVKYKFSQGIQALQNVKIKISQLQNQYKTKSTNPPPTEQVLTHLQKLENKYLEVSRHYRIALKKIRILDNLAKPEDTHLRNRIFASNTVSNTQQTKPEARSSTRTLTTQPNEIAQNIIQPLQAKSSAKANHLSYEVGIKYSHYDRSQLTLNGFLALDSIFLGDIAVEGVEADTYNLSLGLNYDINPDLSLHLNAPFITRSTLYSKGGVGGAATEINQTEVSKVLQLGDISFGTNYRILGNTPDDMALLWNLDLKSPTGKSPYGIPLVEIEVESNEDGLTVFRVPKDLPTGNGLWSFGNTLTVTKNSAPAVLFASMGYNYTLKGSFSDIDSDPDTKTSGDIKLGNSASLSAGFALAINNETSISVAYSQSNTKSAKTRNDNQPWKSIKGSDALAATLSLGLTYAFTDKASLVASLGVGLTDDAPDFTFELKVPFIQ